jgi:2,3-bisphosphoglycerate-independent phosphoglycerate mutase
VEALEKHDFVFLHVEAPDEASHEGSLELKMRAIQDFDRYVVRTVLEEATAKIKEYRLMVVTDHLTPISLRTHASKPVPFAIYDSRETEVKRAAGYNEGTAKETGLFLSTGEELMSLFLQREPAVEEDGK